MKRPSQYGYVVANNICLFQHGPLSQWWGGYNKEKAPFITTSRDIIASRDSKCGIYLDKVYTPYEFNTCEQWMMANKATVHDDLDTFLRIMDTTDPAVQKKLGREVQNFDPVKWDKEKLGIVARGNKFKFAQNPDLQEFLLQFHPFTIFAEASPWDKVWGIGISADTPDALDIYKWKGENLLGRVIGMTRQSLA